MLAMFRLSDIPLCGVLRDKHVIVRTSQLTRQNLEYRVVVVELNSFDKKSMLIANNLVPGKIS